MAKDGLLGRLAADAAHRADVTEEFLEEALLAAQRRGGAAIRIDRGDLIAPGAIDPGDIAGGVEADNTAEAPKIELTAGEQTDYEECLACQ